MDLFLGVQNVFSLARALSFWRPSQMLFSFVLRFVFGMNMSNFFLYCRMPFNFFEGRHGRANDDEAGAGNGSNRREEEGGR